MRGCRPSHTTGQAAGRQAIRSRPPDLSGCAGGERRRGRGLEAPRIEPTGTRRRPAPRPVGPDRRGVVPERRRRGARYSSEAPRALGLVLDPRPPRQSATATVARRRPSRSRRRTGFRPRWATLQRRRPRVYPAHQPAAPSAPTADASRVTPWAPAAVDRRDARPRRRGGRCATNGSATSPETFTVCTTMVVHRSRCDSHG